MFYTVSLMTEDHHLRSTCSKKKIIRNLKASSNAFVLTSVVCFSLSERYKCNLFENFDR